MLIKAADDKQPLLDALEKRMEGDGPHARQAKEDFHRLRAGILGEKDAAYFIDFDYGDCSKNWAVIHDLRVEQTGRVAQIDHLLINRWMEFYVIETKSFNSGVKITEEGEFLRWNNWQKRYEAMESPLSQNERHITVLKDVLDTLALPQRMKMRIPPQFISLVMVSAKAKIIRPKHFDTSRVIKADQLKQRIKRDTDEENPVLTLFKLGKLVAAETVHDLALQLAARHRPLPPQPPPSRPSREHASAPPSSAPAPVEPIPVATVTKALSTIPGPTCKNCRKIAGRILHGKFGYYFKCDSCDSTTSIRFTCKEHHKPRLRKQGRQFFRECEDCGSQDLYHVNAP
ncbi:NERD domain-containing protein [Lysobacter pythonis]|uniref:NERD domain-containing protein n=1 Tax=Solilutibacter pythonis TaxID=2483112 RepID=A0A3M2HV46_9GAMM|nr:nuclease-related domain-containing protein [Lysobacter pythonis]RMH90792.1 NERD domain-containing protein [Lysobacter pythonis]